jgi:hypothetical protein
MAATGSQAAEKDAVKQLKVLGTAIIHKKNLAEGKQNAVDDALVAAVGQVVMETLSGRTVVQRFKVINDNIFAQRDNYIRNFRVLTESVSGSTVTVLVQVDVAVDRVNRDLSRLGLARAGTVYPKVLFMVAEKIGADADYTYWWGNRSLGHRTIGEAAVATTLQADGFEILDTPDLNAPPGLALDASTADMLVLAGELGADVLITGQGTATPAADTTGGAIQPFEAVVELQALNVRTGQSLGRTRQKAVISDRDAVMGSREALSAAGKLAGDRLARQVMAAWQQNQDRGKAIEVVVEGTSGNIASFVRLRTAISSLSGVRDLVMKRMTANQAAMTVNYQGRTQSLADALALETFSGFGIDIFDVTPEVIRIRLMRQ